MATDLDKKFVVFYRQEAKATQLSVDNLRSSQEEADTELILHTLHATERGAQSLRIFTPYTDVLVLATHRYPQLPKDTSFVSTGVKQREISLGKVYGSLRGGGESKLYLHCILSLELTLQAHFLINLRPVSGRDLWMLMTKS